MDGMANIKTRYERFYLDWLNDYARVNLRDPLDLHHEVRSQLRTNQHLEKVSGKLEQNWNVHSRKRGG